MKEFEISLTKALNRGLRPFPEIPDNPMFCEEMYNLMPSELAPRPHERLTQIGGLIGWPWPRLVATEHRVFYVFVVLGVVSIRRVQLDGSNWLNDGPTFTLGSVDEIQQIDVADFGAFVVISTMGFNPSLVCHTFLVSPDGSTLTPLLKPVIGTCCNFRQQFVGANITSPGVDPDDWWGGQTANQAVWSGIGNFDLDPEHDKTAGLSTELFPHSGGRDKPVIYRVLKLQDGPVVYSDAGKIILLPEDVQGNFTYGKTPLNGLGIGGLNHVAGDEYTHGFIDLNNDFWILENSSFRLIEYSGGKLTKRGYRSQITDLIQEDPRVIVSHLARDQRFYISNGSTCLVINKFGACTVHQIVGSVVEGFNKTLYGTYLDSGDLEARVTIEPTDFNSRGLKTVESILGGVITGDNLDKTFFSVDFSMHNSDDFRFRGWITGGVRAEAAVRTTAQVFKIKARISSYLGSQLQSLDVNVKFPDNRFRRGFAAQTVGEQRQNQEQGI